jgi:hypothetical protein
VLADDEAVAGVADCACVCPPGPVAFCASALAAPTKVSTVVSTHTVSLSMIFPIFLYLRRGKRGTEVDFAFRSFAVNRSR